MQTPRNLKRQGLGEALKFDDRELNACLLRTGFAVSIPRDYSLGVVPSVRVHQLLEVGVSRSDVLSGDILPITVIYDLTLRI